MICLYNFCILFIFNLHNFHYVNIFDYYRASGRASVTSWSKGEEEREEAFGQQQAHIKQGWSLLATLHCVLLPDKLISAGNSSIF